jgi:hypothetical protein
MLDQWQSAMYTHHDFTRGRGGKDYSKDKDI